MSTDTTKALPAFPKWGPTQIARPKSYSVFDARFGAAGRNTVLASIEVPLMDATGSVVFGTVSSAVYMRETDDPIEGIKRYTVEAGLPNGKAFTFATKTFAESFRAHVMAALAKWDGLVFARDCARNAFAERDAAARDAAKAAAEAAQSDDKGKGKGKAA